MARKETTTSEKKISLSGLYETALREYGEAVISNRVVPDYRDGLKPVQRAIIWAMYCLNLAPSARFSKCARTVGDVIGKYHPHGDCLRGDTVVPLLSGKSASIEALTRRGKPQWILSLDEDTGTVVPALAHSWRVGQTTKSLYRLTFSTGERIECTGNHPFLSEARGWVSARDLLEGEHIVGGTLDNDEYRALSLTTGYASAVHTLVGEFFQGPLKRKEVYHHVDGNTRNNKPDNLDRLTRARHALHHEHYLEGLEKGRVSMFHGGRALRKAIRAKNSALLRAHNEALPLLKAVKVIRDLLKTKRKLTEENYESYRDRVYNLTRLSTLADKGYSFSELCSIAPDFSLDTSSAVGHTKNLGTKRVRMTRSNGRHNARLLRSISHVMDSLLQDMPIKDVSWSSYRKVARKHAGDNSKIVVYARPSRIKRKFDVVTVQDLASKIPGKLLTVVDSIEMVKLSEPEDFFDFTVDRYENMLIYTSKGKSTGNVVVAHNSSVYDAMVNLSGVKNDDGKTWLRVHSATPLIEGYGNFGDNIENAAAMRYCFTGDSRVMTERGLLRIDSLVSDVHRHVRGRTVEYTDRVASLDKALKASHWVNSGKRVVYELTTERGFKVRATSNEPFLTLSSFEHSWTELKKLRVGDFISMKRGSDVLPRSGGKLPKFVSRGKANSIRYEACEFPKRMSTELAFILGVLVAEGYAGSGVFFNNTDPSYYKKFVRCWKTVFPTIEFYESLHEPRSYGKKKYKLFSVRGMDIASYFESLGVRFGSYNQVIPEVMFCASREEMSSFLSGLFEGDGSIAGVFVDYHSKSMQLYRDIQNVLINYYGCVATIGKTKLYVSGSSNIKRLLTHLTFESKAKKRHAVRLLSEAVVGNTLSDVMPSKFLKHASAFARSAKSYGQHFVAESGHCVSTQGAGSPLSMLSRFPKSSHRANRRIASKLSSFRKFFPKAARELSLVAKRNYFYDRVVSIEKCGREWTYDLTVPGTHAFVANGFIAHNTESRLSSFSWDLLLSPDYLAVADMIPNFDFTHKLPLVMPAKLPMMLLTGSLSIAFGLSANSPSFDIKGVVALVKKALVKPLTYKDCLSLKFKYEYGGVCVSDTEALKQFFKTGKGSLEFLPEMDVDDHGKKVTIRSFCPGLTSANAVNNLEAALRKLESVVRVVNSTDKSGFRLEVVGKRTLDAKAFDALVAEVEKLSLGRVSYDMAVVERKPIDHSKIKGVSSSVEEDRTEVAFWRTSVWEHINEWVVWRLALEQKVLDYLIAKCNERVARLSLLILACKNIKVILDSLSKEDSAAYIATKLKISKEDANAILDLKVRQLKSLEIKKLSDDLAREQREIKSLSKDKKNPAERIIADLDKISLI